MDEFPIPCGIYGDQLRDAYRMTVAGKLLLRRLCGFLVRLACLLVVVAIVLAGCARNESAPDASKPTRTATTAAATTSETSLALTTTSGTQSATTTSPPLPPEPEMYPPAGDLQSGNFTFGIVASYSRETLFWDFRDAHRYLTPAAAEAELQGDYLGSGFNIEPEDPAVQAVVAEVGTEGTTFQIALRLFEWVVDNTEYDHAKAASDDDETQTPAQTMATGNGICRDLAALYISLLRAAGVPARIVTGFIGSSVGGFHAWVEFYGGSIDGMPPWIPVEVSLSGETDLATVVFHFAVQRAENLPQRAWPDIDDDLEWPIWASFKESYVGNETDIERSYDLQVLSEDLGYLCLHLRTGVRYFLWENETDCPPGFDIFVRPLAKQSVRKLDWGYNVTFRGDSRLKLALAEPFLPPQHIEGVTALVYGPLGWTHGARFGMVRLAMSNP